MSTTAQLSENSHQGFEAAKRMLCLGSMQAKSNTASEMPLCLRQNGTGSRSSSKERDAETGLDYFGARYLSSAQGRFVSPDPLMASAVVHNPQTWNRYSYALNNPLRFLDPTGMYVCEGTADECKQFEETRSQILIDSDDEYAIYAAKVYGKLGDDNGMHVNFVDALKNRRGAETNKIGAGYEQNPEKPKSYRAHLMISILRSNINNPETIVHEGSHGADYQAFVKSLSTDLGGWNDSLNITRRQSEIQAWKLSIRYATTGNLTLPYGTCGASECKFKPGMLPSTQEGLIKELLDDPKNKYKGLDLKLYPEFQKPK
jgi:RHS repeat-associated protein